jgi:membrane protein implicated in regulation of membrane protease activity
VYGSLWRILPGPWWVRLVLVLVLVAAALFVLVEWVFPLVNELIPAPDVTVEDS